MLVGRCWRAGVVLGFLALVGCGDYYEGPSSAHYDGERFFNPAPTEPRGWFDFWRWQLTADHGPWPEQLDNPEIGKPPARVDGDVLLVTFAGHAAVLLQTSGLNILTDPIWSERASPVSFAGPKRVRPPGVAFDDLPKIDVVLVSHNHYDHMDLPTLERLWRRDQPRIIVPLGNDTILRDNIEGIEATALDWRGSIEIGRGVSVTATPVQHWSQRTPFDRDRALWSGFLVEAPGGAVFFAGDTGLGTGWWVDDVKAMSAAPIRLALLPIGAYLPRWFMKTAHVTPEEAVRTYQRLGAEHALAVHWGTFPIADDGYEDPLNELRAARKTLDVAAERFRALEPGESWRLAPSAPARSER